METRRRDLLKMGALGAGAKLLSSCTTPITPEKIIPHVIPPEEQIPGIPIFYPTTCVECPAGCGVLVKNREGRAIKLEGNPRHPYSGGALCARGHSALWAEYHPDRYRYPMVEGKKVSWETALEKTSEVIEKGKSALLTGDLSGTLHEIFDLFAQSLSIPRFVWEPISYTPLIRATEIAFGIPTIPYYDLSSATYILSIGTDFLGTFLNPIPQQKGFVKGVRSSPDRFGKVVVLEPRLTLTGANSDEWILIPPGEELYIALGIFLLLFEEKKNTLPPSVTKILSRWIESFSFREIVAHTDLPEELFFRLKKELLNHSPSIVFAGSESSGENGTLLYLLSHCINYLLGNFGKTVRLGEKEVIRHPQNSYDSIVALQKEIEKGTIQTLIVYQTDPAYTLAGTGFPDLLKKLRALIVLDPLPTETSAYATHILPDHGVLEKWGDVERYGDYYGIRQPALNPLWDTREVGDTLLDLLRIKNITPPYDSFLSAVKKKVETIQKVLKDTRPPEKFWEEVLSSGGVPIPRKDLPVTFLPGKKDLPPLPPLKKKEDTLLLTTYPHIYLYDGRGSNRGWLQEIPDPIHQVAHSGYVEIHPETAKSLQIEEGDKVQITSPYGSIELFALLTPGIHRNLVGVPMGFGHSKAIGRYGSEIPGNAFALLSGKDGSSSALPLSGIPVQIKKVAPREKELISNTDYNLISLAGSKNQLGRPIAQVIPLSAIKNHTNHTHQEEREEEKPEPGETVVLKEEGFYPPHEHPEHRWGMVIDLTRCIGCSACMVACMSENNIPVVGRKQVAKGREMFWIRIERYFEGDGSLGGDVRFVPMLCQQCNNAPCEPVCPVLATMHGVEGLNEQVYNRCVGTRYCANNCPYKVRRFNWFGYDDPKGEYYAFPEPLPLMLNPDVTVRSKGVMEKCTFCIQRIRVVTENARLEGRDIQDGEIVPACAETCPGEAIVFGDLNDPSSKVSRMQKDPRGYKILPQLNTQPAITYLRKIRYEEV